MPPWLPVKGELSLRNARHLSEEHIETLKRWSLALAPEGDGEAASMPHFPEDWELGPPDLVLSMAEAYELPADGGDVFRNFVLSVPIDRVVFVRGFELRPSEKRLVHHATMTIDPTRSSQRLDQLDPEPGFDGMRAAPGALMPDGHFLGWTPGKAPVLEPEEMSWRLAPGSDIVLQLHMPTTGKRELVSARLGLYLTDSPPTLVPVTIRLGSRTIDIEPYDRDYRVRDAYVLPVDVRALAIYPHAHRLARRMIAEAIRPDGTRQRLLDIPAWDFNWQDFYRFETPLVLSAGTRITMEYSYDNSDDNPRNPARPPVPVAYGPQTNDEMGDLYLQVLPERADELHRLRADVATKDHNRSVTELRLRLERDPRDAHAWNELGFTFHALDRPEEAVEAFRTALRVSPDLTDPLFNLATLLAARGAREEAVRYFRKLVEAEPECVDCIVRMGNSLRELGRFEEARAWLEEAVALDEGRAWTHYSLGIVLQLTGHLDPAIERYRTVVRLAPDDLEARLSLGAALVGAGRCTPGIFSIQSALARQPDWPAALTRLAWALTSCPRHSPDAVAQAVSHAQRAAVLTNYDDPEIMDTLGDALAAAGESGGARDAYARALEVVERSGDPARANTLREKLTKIAE